jgi:hypothetical protein
MKAKFMNKQPNIIITSLLSLVVLTLSTVATAEERTDGMRFVPDVVDQFTSLTLRADALGFRIGNTPNPSDCKHYQGLARVESEDGTPFFMVSRSGNTPDVLPSPLPDGWACDDSPGETGNGHLIIFQAGSRDKNGERLRSNKLKKGASVKLTMPPENAIATTYYTVVGGDPTDSDPDKRPGLVFEDGPEGWLRHRVYQHPGGMQAIGDVLALAADGRHISPYVGFEMAPDPSIVMFFDVSSPEDPIFKSRFIPIDENGTPLPDADAIGITPLPGDRYLMVVSGGFEDDPHHYYRSTSGDLKSPELSWEYVGNTPGPSPGDNINQSLNFLRQGDINGPLFLAAARGMIRIKILSETFGGDDKIALYEIECETPECEPGKPITLTDVVIRQNIHPLPSVGGHWLASLAAASGFYVSPTGELLFYAFKHDNDGWHGQAQVGEWRHKNVVRSDSPTVLPTLELNGPYEVDEGDSVILSGVAASPITKAWIQPVLSFGGYYPIVDFDDYNLDDFDNLTALYPHFSHLPETLGKEILYPHLWSWYAPEGCSIQALDNESNVLRTLEGTGFVEQDDDLSLVMNDEGSDNIDLKVNSVQFLDDCNENYTTPLTLEWDLDLDGSYETAGDSVEFSADSVDGPSTLMIPAQVIHPLDGSANQSTVTITVHNVAPQIGELLLFDGAGHVINADVPFVLTGTPVTAEADFIDPGVLDHQSATLDWGDGQTDTEIDFTTYEDAFGGVTGAVSHSHNYTIAGSYSIVLSVMDDDNGADSNNASVDVQTPEEAVNSIVLMLNNILATTSEGNVRKKLERAIKALTGVEKGKSVDGALIKIKNDSRESAIDFLQQAIFWLNQAQIDDANLPITLLEQVVIALSVM